MPDCNDLFAACLSVVPAEEEGLNCLICYQDATEAGSLLRLPCHTGHVFCSKCIYEWSLQPRGNTCPQCRTFLFEMRNDGKAVDQQAVEEGEAVQDEEHGDDYWDALSAEIDTFLEGDSDEDEVEVLGEEGVEYDELDGELLSLQYDPVDDDVDDSIESDDFRDLVEVEIPEQAIVNEEAIPNAEALQSAEALLNEEDGDAADDH